MEEQERALLLAPINRLLREILAELKELKDAAKEVGHDDHD